MVDYSEKSFYYWYYLPLLTFSVVLGLIKSSRCLNFYLIPGSFDLKIVIYFMLVLGIVRVIFQRNWFPFLRSSIRLLDSLGPLVPLQGLVLRNKTHQLLDLGVLP